MALYLDHDPVTGIRRDFHYNHADDTWGIETRHDCEPLIEVNKARFNQVRHRAPWPGHWEHVAAIDPVVYAELVREGIAQDPKAFKRWLNDRDNAVWRTRPGRI